MIKLFSKNKNNSKYKDIGSVLDPHKHWILLLWMFLVLVATLILFSLYLLFQIRNDQVFQVKATLDDKPAILKDDLLKKVTDSFEEKSKKEAELKTNPPSYEDPST